MRKLQSNLQDHSKKRQPEDHIQNSCKCKSKENNSHQGSCYFKGKDHLQKQQYKSCYCKQQRCCYRCEKRKSCYLCKQQRNHKKGNSYSEISIYFTWVYLICYKEPFPKLLRVCENACPKQEKRKNSIFLKNFNFFYWQSTETLI